MHPVALLVALSALGIDHTWRQTEAEKIEYVVQIEPVVLHALLDGQPIESELPADITRVDRICLRIGSGDLRTLPQIAPTWEPLDQPPEKQAAANSVPLSVHQLAEGKAYQSFELTHGWEPAGRGTSRYLIQLDPAFVASLSEGDEIYTNVQGDAGVVRSFRITAGKDALPQESGTPPAAKAQFQSPTKGGSSAAADVPLVTDMTDGAGAGSVYGGNATNADDSGAGSTATLQPPTTGLLDAPTFDREQFSRPRSGTGFSGTTAGTRYASQQPTTPPRPRTNNGQQVTAAEYQPDEEPTRVAARSLPAGEENFSRRSSGFQSDTASDEKKPEFPALPFTLSLFALFLSMGANLYLGWTAAEFYSRYKLAVERLRGAGR